MAGLVHGYSTNYIVDEIKWEKKKRKKDEADQQIIHYFDENHVSDVLSFYLYAGGYRYVDLESILCYKEETGKPYTYDELCELEEGIKNFFADELNVIDICKNNTSKIEEGA